MTAGTASGPQGFRLRFLKLGEARFLSHSDLLRTFERALRRTGRPLAFTQGFNPHPRISARPAIALGFEACFAALEVFLEGDCDPAELAADFGARLPGGLVVSGACKLPPGRPSPLRRVVWRFPSAAPDPGQSPATDRISAKREPSGALEVTVCVEKGKDPPGAPAIASLLWPGCEPAQTASGASLITVEFEDGL